jgi:hypothetical protein
VTTRNSSARSRSWAWRFSPSSWSRIVGGAPDQTSTSAAATAIAYPAGRQYEERSITAGGWPSANKTLPARSP